MSKKIILNEEQTKECLRLYNEELLGSVTISERMGITKGVILRTLRESGIVLGPSGRRNIGGKKVADKRWVKKNKTHVANYQKEWADKNKTKLKTYNQQWNLENREHVNKYKRDYERTRRANDPKYRLGHRTRTALWTCLKEANVSKYRSTFEILGYSIEELMNHLEGLFLEGMTWENYGEWHVDHKIPMASFKFTSVEDNEFKICWSLENLQPLWGSDNLIKGSKIIF